MGEENRVDIDLQTNRVQKSPLNLSDETLKVSATVLANKLLDYARRCGTYENMTPEHVFRKEEKD